LGYSYRALSFRAYDLGFRVQVVVRDSGFGVKGIRFRIVALRV
jgi:hypothetical protein